MITKLPTNDDLNNWKKIYIENKDKIKPNRKTGKDILEYLQHNYVLTEIFDDNALNCIVNNVMLNDSRKEKLPNGKTPLPKAFYLENTRNGVKFYSKQAQEENKTLFGSEIKRIFVGIDLESGFYTVEGSTLLYDELCVFQGLDEADLKNYVLVAQYILNKKRLSL